MELGLLTSMGWRKRGIFALLLTRSLVIGLLGTAVGILLLYGIRDYLTNTLAPEKIALVFNIFPIIPSPAYLPQAPLLSISLSALAFTVGYVYYLRLPPLKMLEET